MGFIVCMFLKVKFTMFVSSQSKVKVKAQNIPEIRNYYLNLEQCLHT